MDNSLYCMPIVIQYPDADLSTHELNDRLSGEHNFNQCST